jgi:hypothetical protein
MNLPDHLRIESRRAVRTRVLLRVAPALLYVPIAIGVLAAGAATQLVCATVAFGVVAIVIAGPLALRRLRGFAELPAVRREVNEARAMMEAGRAHDAADVYERAASRLAGRLYANHFLVLLGVAAANAQLGQAHLARAVLDDLAASGWIDTYSLRRHRSLARASEATTRAMIGDVAGAQRAIAEATTFSRIFTREQRDVAAAVVAVRAGASDASAQVDAVLGSPAISERVGSLLVAYRAFDAHRSGDAARETKELDLLRARPRRDYAALVEGWPELHAYLLAQGFVDANGRAKSP